MEFCSLRGRKKAEIITAFDFGRGLIWNKFRPNLQAASTEPGAVRYPSGLRALRASFYNHQRKGMTMKQLFTVLVAAMFAASSVAALAQDKKDSKGMDKKSSSSMEKKSDKSSKSKSKSSTDKKSGSMDKKSSSTDKKAAKKSETK
jgi:hypothetical protein